MGGGVHCQNGASPTIENCVFDGNQAKTGGGFSCIGGSPRLVGCTFVRNHAYELDGGGALCTDGSEPSFIDCVFDGNTTVGGGAGLSASSSRVELSGCTFTGNASSPYNGGGAIFCGWGSTVAAAGCTFAGNSSPDGAGVMCYPDGMLYLNNSIIAFSAQGQAIALYGTSAAVLSCCDLYGNPGGDWVGAVAGQLGLNGNIAADPLFCDPAQDDYHLQPGSPCLAHTPPNPGCDLVGAWPMGCSTMDVDADVVPVPAPAPGTALRIEPPIVRANGGPVRVVFELPPCSGPQSVRLAVYDSAGRQVGLLANGPRLPGLHELAWPATGQGGGPLPSGLYYCRLTAASGAATRALIVLR
jgi:hypothetical protein